MSEIAGRESILSECPDPGSEDQSVIIDTNADDNQSVQRTTMTSGVNRLTQSNTITPGSRIDDCNSKVV